MIPDDHEIKAGNIYSHGNGDLVYHVVDMEVVYVIKPPLNWDGPIKADIGLDNPQQWKRYPVRLFRKDRMFLGTAEEIYK